MRAERSSKLVIALALTGILWGSVTAYADDVEITSKYPFPYGEFRVAYAETLGGGDASTPITTEVHGDLFVNGDLTLINSKLRIAPNMGPYGRDGFRIGTDGNVSIGANNASTMRFKAHTVIAAHQIYALDYDSGLGTRLYGSARGFLDLTETGDLQKRAQFYAMYDNATPVDFADDAAYAPMRVDGYYVRLGEKLVDRVIQQPNGNMDNVLIGTKTLDLSSGIATDKIFLQVGDPGDGTEARGNFTTFSSKEFKTDLMPMDAALHRAAMSDIRKVRPTRYHLRADKPDSPARLGLIAEEAPAAMVSSDRRALSLSDSMGYLAAALKHVQERNARLEARIAELESRRSELLKSHAARA